MAVKPTIKNKMAANIVCYYNFAHEQKISIALPAVINKTGGKIDKLADCHRINREQVKTKIKL